MQVFLKMKILVLWNLRILGWYLIHHSHIEVELGIYKILFSTYITGVDVDHGIEVYLMDDTGAAIKDFDYKLEQGTLS